MVQRDKNYWRMKYYGLLAQVDAGEFRAKSGHDTAVLLVRELIIMLRDTPVGTRDHHDNVLLMHLASYLYANGEATPNG